MQQVACPGCGAPVQFRSHASVLAVCEFCKTTILKDADAVKNLGKMSDVLEDYSPVQIGTAGVFDGVAFSVIGRIQLRYSGGMWNEWYVLFDDGNPAWLGDASGQYTLTKEIRAHQQLPAFETLVPARHVMVDGVDYLAADVRTAECIGGQGELPFRVGQGWQAKVADLRSGSRFLTLDYSDSNTPLVYTGSAVTLESLQCQLLRDDDQVRTSAGKFKGKVEPLACPSCGSSIPYLPGVTTTVLCPSCHARLDAAGPEAQVLDAATRMEQVSTTLRLGDEGTIDTKKYQIIGLMKLIDDENVPWTEYLLHNPGSGFLWLIETSEGWARASVLDDWPEWRQEDVATLGPVSYRKFTRYPARVMFAAGAFNWRVSVGDRTENIEFQSGPNKLAAEITPQEITWSRSTPVSADQVLAWFGKGVAPAKAVPGDALASLVRKFILIILVLNAIPLLATFGRTWFPVALGIAAVYFPARYLKSLGQDGK
ncbi:MAG: hypothetical protein JWR21_2102 [Herminiimonas sp.]|nr:hypothetical protein [Herminiimonas sp.]